MTDSVLSAIRGLLQRNTGTLARMTWDAWETDTAARGEHVTLYRDYVDGKHRAKLTQEMIDLLRLDGTVAKDVSPFNINHMDNIVQTPADRLDITRISADNQAGTDWAADLFKRERLDGLQLAVHEGAVRDGDAFVMVSFDNETGEVRLMAEDAYDGIEGVIPIYAGDSKTPSMAVKIWRENLRLDNNRLSERVRINVYYPGQIEKYLVENGGALQAWRDQPGDVWPYPWRMPDGEPIGVPLVHFANNPRYMFGRSAIDDAIPLQDALNRVLTSMVMATELSGFMIRTAKGTKPPAKLTPGMWVSAYARDKEGKERPPIGDEVTWLANVEFGTLEAGEITPFLEEAAFLIDQMYVITRTPPKHSGATISGEALKQLEIGLLGKIRRAHISFGNAWENVAAMAHRVQSAYGTQAPPAVTTWSAQWKTAAIRDDAQVVASALSIADRVDERTFLEMIASVWNWDDAKIDAILDARRGDQATRLAQLGVGGLLPGFGGNRPADDEGVQDDEQPADLEALIAAG